VNFASSPDDERFTNKRVEMWWKLAQWVKKDGKLPIDNDLIVDLTSVRYDHDNAKQKVFLETKDDLRKRIGRSPDKGDSAAITFSYAVYNPSPVEQLLGRHQDFRNQERYNPLKRARERAMRQ
jgi:hypothetical protein